ncbi:MAG: TldD/PmbA family protein [Mycobacteriaceae bacterium]|nr:TldD/PmbA family protein [Mycobacteriaceae bacterium]
MIAPQKVVDDALAASTVDETIVVVTDRAEASLRWANSSMTTNGVSMGRSTTVISIVRDDAAAHVASVQTSEVDPAIIADIVAASEDAARSAPPARDSAPLITGAGAPGDWDQAVLATGAEVFGALAASLSRGFKGPDTLYGYARHEMATTFLASSTGLRRRFTQPTGSIEINAKRDGASAWAGVGTPDFLDVPTDELLAQLSTRLGWSRRTVSLPAGRYPTLMPPSTVADVMIYMAWMMDGRAAQEGRTAFSAPGGGTRVGERLTTLPVTLYSDPSAKPLECLPFVATSSSSETMSVFDNGMDVDRVDWIREGVINALAYPRAAAAEFGSSVAVPAGNLLMTGGDASLDEMIAETERALLLTTLWYIRTVDPTLLLLTGLTRDGVYLVEDGKVSAAVNNFRFNESPLDLLQRATQVGATQTTLPREWGDWATRAAMPSLRIPDFYMSSVSEAQ